MEYLLGDSLTLLGLKYWVTNSYTQTEIVVKHPQFYHSFYHSSILPSTTIPSKTETVARHLALGTWQSIWDTKSIYLTLADVFKLDIIHWFALLLSFLLTCEKLRPQMDFLKFTTKSYLLYIFFSFLLKLVGPVRNPRLFPEVFSYNLENNHLNLV